MVGELLPVDRLHKISGMAEISLDFLDERPAVREYFVREPLIVHNIHLVPLQLGFAVDVGFFVLQIFSIHSIVVLSHAQIPIVILAVAFHQLLILVLYLVLH